MAFSGAFAFIGARWLSFIALFIVIGVVTFRFGVIDRMRLTRDDNFRLIASSNAATFGIVGCVAAVIAAALKLSRESADMPDVSISAMLFHSPWGGSVLLQSVAALIGAIAFRKTQTGTESSQASAWKLALTAAACLAVSAPLGGHAASGRLALAAIPADLIHIVAGSAWLGTLAVIVVVGISAALKTPDISRPGARVATMANTFSPIALASGGIIVATGIASSIIRLTRLDSLWTTPYGIVLILKLIFVAMAFAAGAWNWRRMKPRLTGDDRSLQIKSIASFELVLGAVVLAITAVLVSLELP